MPIPLQIRDLVIIQSENIPKSHWSFGRIIETYLEKDSIVRTVKVKMPNNEPIGQSWKLYLLGDNYQ